MNYKFLELDETVVEDTPRMSIAELVIIIRSLIGLWFGFSMLDLEQLVTVTRCCS